MQVLDRSRLMAIPPIWRLGFRPFFLGGALFAVLAICLLYTSNPPLHPDIAPGVLAAPLVARPW